MQDIENTIKELETKTEFRFIRKPIHKNSDDWQLTAFHWLIILPTGDTVDYYMGQAHCDYAGYGLYNRKEWEALKYKNLTPCGFDKLMAQTKPKKPTMKDILYSLVRDGEAYTMSFREWCDNLGYNHDSIADRNVYDECCKNADKLFKLQKAFLNSASLAQLQEFFQDY